MSETINLSERIVREKKKNYVSGDHIRGRIIGDKTFINVNTLKNDYKLARAYTEIRNLEYRSDMPVEKKTFTKYINKFGERLKLKMKIEEKPRPKFSADEKYRNRKTKRHYPKGNLMVLVDSDVYKDVKDSVEQYVLDVSRDGYWATIHVYYKGSPSDIRSYLKKKKLVGALLVGAIPAGWYEIDGDQFPCDLYYMDLDGTWTDPDNNGKFNDHTNNLNPEIFIGRLWTPTMNGNDTEMINDYFRRNHLFRLGKMGHARSALAYVDDDWTGFGDCAFDEMFPASVIEKYNDPVTTDADLYKSEVNNLRSWTQLCAHSSVHSHALRVGTNNEYITTNYFRDVNPPNSHFYNLFCCGPGKFTTSDYLGGWYVFDKKGGGTNNGMAAIASAKSGSMLFFEDFYKPMGKGKVIGDAFLNWWKERGPSHEDWERYWFYGLVLIGDPTLNWWKGAVPTPELPEDGDVFDHWPRKIELRWDPVNLKNVKYDVEIDAFGAVNAGKWAEATGQQFMFQHNITKNTLEHNFVGMQRGRWRVRAVVAGTKCSWSPWSYFKFTV